MMNIAYILIGMLLMIPVCKWVLYLRQQEENKCHRWLKDELETAEVLLKLSDIELIHKDITLYEQAISGIQDINRNPFFDKDKQIHRITKKLVSDLWMLEKERRNEISHN